MSRNYTLEPCHLACERHIQPFLFRWPKGLNTFTKLMAMELPGLHLGRTAKTVINALKKEPLCCRLDEKALFSCYATAHMNDPFLITGQCNLCETVGPGTPFDTRNGGVELRRWDHLCTRCFYFGFDLAACQGLLTPKDPMGWWNDDISPRGLK